MSNTTPKDLRDVLAQIETQTDLGKSSWYEVVYHNGKEWYSYSGSDTFSTYGYNVVQWKYVDEIFGEKPKLTLSSILKSVKLPDENAPKTKLMLDL